MSTPSAGLTASAAFHLHYGLVEPGTTVADRFEILSAIERGGTREIYRARDRVGGGDVAIEVVRVDVPARERFAREVQLLAELDDPRIVRHVAHGALPSGGVFLAIEWLDADSLAERMSVGLTARRAAEVGAAIAQALAAIHARGVVHRNVCPANVMLTKAGDIKLVELGLAWVPDGARLTQTGAVLGTLGYIAPEQIVADGRVDPRADLFALGCVLYLMFTGQPAFHADTVMGMQARTMFESPVPLRDRAPTLPRELGTLVEQLLAKDPANRPATARAVAAALDALAPSLDDVVARPFLRQPEPERQAPPIGGRSVVVVDAAPERVAAVVRGAEMTAMIGGGALLATVQSDETSAIVGELQRALPNARVWVEHIGGKQASSLGLEDTAASDGTGDTTAATHPRAATVIKSTDRYEFKRVIGQGGLGRVLLAHDRELDRPVAIKELLRHTPVSNERFRREALVTARLQHPNIVPVHDAGQWPNGSPFYAMKLVEGEDLTKLINRAPDLAGRLALLPKVIAVCEAMAYAHDQRIIHRDLKPSNIVVGEFGEALIVDWGLAKHLDAEDIADSVDTSARKAATENLTRVGDVLGTPAYMAPEQASGARIDPRADVYALGAILYHLLCGHAPYDDVRRTTLAALFATPPTPIEERVPDVPVELVAIVRKAMARAAEERYASALDLARELRRFETGQLVSAHRYTFKELVRKWARRHRTTLVIATVAATALVVVGVYALVRVLAAERVAQQERAVAISERSRAQAESLRLRVSNAEQALARDPTEALAWLAIDDVLPDELHARATAVATKAVALGVAHTVHQLRGRIHWLDSAGDHVAAGSRHGQVRVWTRAGAPVMQVEVGEAAHVATLARDGRQLLVATADGRVRWWRRFQSAPDELSVPSVPRHAAFLRDDLVAITSVDGSVTLWPSAGASRTHAIHSGEVSGLVAIDGDAVTVAADGHLARTGLTGVRWRVRAHADVAQHVARVDADRLVTVGEDAMIRVWRASDGGKLAELDTGDPLFEVAAAGDEIIAAGDAKVLHRWRIGDSRESTVAVAFLAYGLAARPALLAAGTGPAVRVLRGDAELTLTGHPDAVERVVAPTDDELVSADRGGQVRFWTLPPHDQVILRARASTAPVRVKNGWIVGTETGAVIAFDATGAHRTLFQVQGAVSAVRATADASTIAAVDGKRTYIWRNGSTVPIGAASTYKLELTTDGAHVAVLAAAGELQLWRTSDATLRRREAAAKGLLVVHGSRVFWQHPVRGVLSLDLEASSPEPVTLGSIPSIAVVALPDALAIGSGSGVVQIVSKRNAVIASHDFEGDLFSLVRAGSELWFGGADGRIRAWEPKAGTQRVFVGHERWIHGIDVSPSERTAASWSLSSTEVRLWNVQSGATRSVVLGANARGAALDEAGSRAAIADVSGTVTIVPYSELRTIHRAGFHRWVRAQTRVVR